MEVNNQRQEGIIEEIGEGIGYVNEYASQKLTYFKLKAVERAALAGSALITLFLISLLGLFVLGFAGITLGLYLGQYLDSYILGFFSVTGIFLLLLLFIVIFRRQIITNPLVTSLIQLLQ